MLTIRLQRIGRKHDPSFRVVAVDSRRGPKSGNFIEVLGSYNARRGKPVLKTDRINYWLGVGAQTSPTVHNLLVSSKVMVEPKIAISIKVKAKAAVTDEVPVEVVEAKPAEEVKVA